MIVKCKFQYQNFIYKIEYQKILFASIVIAVPTYV